MGFNATLVVSTLDFEVTRFSPGGAPAVGNLPVFHAIFDSPSNNTDSMASQSRSSDVMVDTSLVVVEISVNSEGTLNWSIFVDFLLDGGFGCTDVVVVATVMFVCFVRGAVTAFATVATRWRACITVAT